MPWGELFNWRKIISPKKRELEMQLKNAPGEYAGERLKRVQ